LTDVTIASGQARIGPIVLKTSEAMRLRRLARSAIVKEEVRQIVVPLPRGVDVATFLVGFLRELVPRPESLADGPRPQGSVAPQPVGSRP
jgi:hypothetical protein